MKFKQQPSVRVFLLMFAAAIVSCAFAQNKTFTLRPGITPFVRGTPDPNYPWPNYYESERFIIRYTQDQTHDAYVTETAARSALETLERTYDSIVTKYNYVTPYHPNASTKYKSEVSISRGRQNSSGQSAWADGGGTAYGGLLPSAWNTSANTTQRPIQWIPSSMGGTTLSHEWGHGLQQISGGMRDSDMVGWFHESHTQWMVNQVHRGTSGNLNASRVVMRQAHIHPGYAPSRYENWPFLEHIFQENGRGTTGWAVINNIWTKSPKPTNSARTTADPFEWIQRGNPDIYPDWESLGDLFGRFAMKSVIYDYGTQKSVFRTNYNASSIAETERYQRYTYLQALDTNDVSASNNRYVSPHSYAPQRLAFNIIRLYPQGGGNWAAGNQVTVKFRGDVQTANNMRNYARSSSVSLEPLATLVQDNPGSDWRYGLVAVTGQAASTSASVTARYSDLMRAINDGQLTQPDVSITMQSGEIELYLVVAATPTVNHKVKWDQIYYTIYRFPYMVEINGAKPEGFQQIDTTNLTRHTNGGGFVERPQNVDPTVYVGPNAQVLGQAVVRGNARIEGRAAVRGGTVRGNAVIKDYASVRSGTVEGDAVISDGATIWGATVNQNAKVHGSALLTGGTVTGNAQVGGAVVTSGSSISGTARFLGDGYGSLTANSGVYYGARVAGRFTSGEPAEFTKPLSRTWYGENTAISSKAPVIAHKNTAAFKFDKYGNLRYDLGGAQSASLKVFDARGRVIKTMALNGSQTTVNTNIKAASQMLLWKVDINGKTVGSGRLKTILR